MGKHLGTRLKETMRHYGGPLTVEDVYQGDDYSDKTLLEVASGLESLFQSGKILKLESVTPKVVSPKMKEEYGVTYYLI